MHARWALALSILLVAEPAGAGPKVKDRPLPGFAGLSYRDVEVRGGCTDHVRVIRRTRKVDDPELVALLTWPTIKGLDFSPDDAARARTSMGRFQEWFQRLTAQGSKVSQRQTAIAGDATRPAVTRVEAAARLAVGTQQIVDLILGIEVPRHLRKDPEVLDAFCDVLSDSVEPLQARVDQIRGACAKLIDDNHVGPGWWSDVCVAPPATP